MSDRRRDSIRSSLGGLALDDFTGGAGSSRHPLGEDFAFEVSEQLYLMDPRKIVLEGPYVRTWFEDDDFQNFCRAVQANGDIGQAIGIRTVGPALERRYVLVYGMRRWKASLMAGLEKIPVRDYGEISEDEALSLQMIENEMRANPHPVDTAYGYHLLVAQGRTQTEVAETHGRKQSYVSYMSKVGEAIRLLSDEERTQLYAIPGGAVRAFQQIAQLGDPKARAAKLRGAIKRGTWLDEVDQESGDPSRPRDATRPPESKQEGEGSARQVFQVSSARGGRSFRVRWTSDDLRKHPVKFAAEFHSRIVDEYRAVVDRLHDLEREQRKRGKRAQRKPADPEQLAAAAARLERALQEMQGLLPPPDGLPAD